MTLNEKRLQTEIVAAEYQISRQCFVTRAEMHKLISKSSAPLPESFPVDRHMYLKHLKELHSIYALIPNLVTRKPNVSSTLKYPSKHI